MIYQYQESGMERLVKVFSVRPVRSGKTVCKTVCKTV
jgi:hypothetical protein